MDGLVVSIVLVAAGCLVFGYLLGQVGGTTATAVLFAVVLLAFLAAALRGVS